MKVTGTLNSNRTYNTSPIPFFHTCTMHYGSIRLIISSMLLQITICAGAIDKLTVQSITDQVLVYDSPIELHITNTENAIVNSTISLNHIDAWVFFDNIPPDQVINHYLQYIKVNGNDSNGVNGRVAIYGHGAVIIPHSGSFEPLTLYSEEGFKGDSMKFSVFQFYNGLDEFGGKARSMRLKRGYMATLATDPDGSGYSRVFIADKKDIEIDSLQAELHENTTFVRVFKHQWVNKKGKAGLNPHDINATSYYDWNIAGSSSSNVEYVAIRQNAGWPSWSAIKEKRDISHLLGFNEPDRPDQSDMDFQQIIDLWPGMMTTGLRIGSPAWSNPWGGDGGNLFDFIETCDAMNYRVDFVALHCYWGGKSPINWYNDLKYIHELTGRPLWLTEWNNGANWTTESWPDADRSYTPANAEKQLNDMKGILQVLDTASFIERYFIYDWVQDCRAMVLDGNLTLAGEYYASNPSQIAYNSKFEVIPPVWRYAAPSLSYQYLTLSNKISLRFTDPNGNMTRGFSIEKKVNAGNYETIYESEDNSVTNIADEVDNSISGRIAYRLRIKTVYDTYIYSNEVSYYQSEGTENFQYGLYPCEDSEWNMTLFSEEFPEPPIIISGIPSFNNIVALTHRVSNIKTKNYKFNLDPWNYQNDPVLTKSEYIALMALPEGIYNFNGLNAEVASVSEVNSAWVTVDFEHSFDSVPVVFCTQASSYSYIPTMPAVRNVTTEGFEICLRCEENLNTTLIRNETIHFLAVEPGKGAINDLRIMVGRSEEGIANDPISIKIDSSFQEPAIFGSLLSAEDVFASTLRYYKTGDNEYTIMKQRELSGQLVVMKHDTLAWMVMDLAGGHIIENLEKNLAEQLIVYPNPASNYLTFKFGRPTDVRIYDLYGRELIHDRIDHELDISGIDAGLYLIKAEGYRTTRFIKK